MPVCKNSVTLEKLIEQIRISRNQMQQLWDEKGYTDEEVLAASIELDHLLNEYYNVTGFLKAKIIN
ncbi:MAG TPA: aspartyl-phosphate phosphatase Spo0E family protein [Firmicutes bacterium]|jgi:hypothetical protein|nr:aspartyl-phosphate phosphatase Spo0E family protein [Bacillota bacterium]